MVINVTILVISSIKELILKYFIPIYQTLRALEVNLFLRFPLARKLFTFRLPESTKSL